MIELNIIFTLVIGHWFADFVCQTDQMAQNKSKSNLWLLIHGVAYSLALFALILLSMGFGLIEHLDRVLVLYIFLNGLIHICIDYFTSRLSSKLWKSQKVHNFFVVIGLDQALHMITLFGTYVLIFKG